MIPIIFCHTFAGELGPLFNTLRLRQNGRLFTDDTFKCIFLNENIRISIKISLKYVPKVSINNNPALVLIMAWHRPGDKPLSEPMLVRSLTQICVTRPQWVNWVNWWTLWMLVTYTHTYMTGDALSHQTSPIMIFSMPDKQLLVMHGDRFQLFLESQCWEMSKTYLGRYSGCWCIGSFCWKVISSFCIDYIK